MALSLLLLLLLFSVGDPTESSFSLFFFVYPGPSLLNGSAFL